MISTSSYKLKIKLGQRKTFQKGINQWIIRLLEMMIKKIDLNYRGLCLMVKYLDQEVSSEKEMMLKQKLKLLIMSKSLSNPSLLTTPDQILINTNFLNLLSLPSFSTQILRKVQESILGHKHV